MENELNIHPQAWVDDTIFVGARTRIWQFATVIRGARLGDDCNVAASATVDGAVLGNNCIVCHGAFVVPGCFIGNRVFIGPNVSFCNDKWPKPDKTGFEQEKLASLKDWVVIVGDDVSIGANSVILPGVVLHENAVIAAGSVVTKSVPAGHLWKKGGHRPIGDGPRERMKWIR